jgi:hypothetical protein
MGPGLLVRASWSRSNSDREIEKLGRNGVAEATQEMKHHRSSVRVRRIVTVPFEFKSDFHCRIKRDPSGSLDRRTSEQGSSDEKKARAKVVTSNPIGERDQRPTGIAGNRVAWEIISQGGPAIQTTFLPRDYVSASGELWGKKRVTPNCRCMPPQI